MLAVGSEIVLERSGRRGSVRRFIGEGSQGAVFDVVVEPSGEHLAAKWYFPSSSLDRQRAAILRLIELGAPDDRFLWPIETISAQGEDGLGYVMPLRDSASVGLSDLLTGRVDVPFSTVCTLGMELAHSFLSLHNEGLCYRDISFGNVFFDPRTGRPCICDNDNVGVDGASPSAVLGTRRFMAPEIVRREAAPSTATDLYSLSVLLFYLLMVGHPLVGRRELEFGVWDDKAESLLFGSRPLFVFDPSDDSNAPLPELHGAMLANWDLFPPAVRTLFLQAFTEGLADPARRVRESVWRSALAGLRDSVVRCRACSRESFWRADLGEQRCWSCDRVIPAPVRAEIGDRSLVLDPGTGLCRHHLRRDYDFASVVGRVVEHPTRPGRYGLRNETDRDWEARLSDGSTAPVEPGRSVGLVEDTQLTIDGVVVSLVR